jgi:hypothetical protein
VYAVQIASSSELGALQSLVMIFSHEVPKEAFFAVSPIAVP